MIDFTPDGVLKSEVVNVASEESIKLNHSLFSPNGFVIKYGDVELEHNRDYVFTNQDERIYKSHGLVAFRNFAILNSVYFNKDLDVEYRAMGDYISVSLFDEFETKTGTYDKLNSKVDTGDFNDYKKDTEKKLVDETTARSQSDILIQSNLDNEIEAREQANNTLQSNIDSEAQAREQADTTLQNNLDDEIEAREQAIIDTEQLVLNESVARGEAVESLQTQINTKYENVIYFEDSGKLRFTKDGYDSALDDATNLGKFTEVDTALEKLAVNFELVGTDLVVTLSDETTQTVDLSSLVNGGTVIDSQIANNLSTEESGFVLDARQGKVLDDAKVDKVEGQGLSTNDFTDALESKLNGLDAGDKLTLTSAQKTACTREASTTESGLMSADDKVVLNGIQEKSILVTGLSSATPTKTVPLPSGVFLGFISTQNGTKAEFLYQITTIPYIRVTYNGTNDVLIKYLSKT